MAWKILLCILFGYLIGGINPSYIIGRIRGFDIRKKGSGNAGASNAVIVMGKTVGVLIAIFDILKAAAAYWLATLIFKDLTFAAEIAGVACILGHMFPVYMKFKGGKGLACLGGVLLGMDWRFFFAVLATEILLCILVNYICIVPITTSIVMPIAYGLFGAQGVAPWFIKAENGWAGAAILSIATVAMLYRHIQNLRRIVHGTEMRFSYLWMKDDARLAERQRIERNGERYQQKKEAKQQAKTENH
ncbi:MAG: glycerol-3-phosphate acyltransferase [Clostridia bacterium]|nr:glycerol-3-phosphate acyltransferase [Clostridia bacterium]